MEQSVKRESYYETLMEQQEKLMAQYCDLVMDGGAQKEIDNVGNEINRNAADLYHFTSVISLEDAHLLSAGFNPQLPILPKSSAQEAA